MPYDVTIKEGLREKFGDERVLDKVLEKHPELRARVEDLRGRGQHDDEILDLIEGKYSVGQFLENVPKSGAAIAKDLYQAVRHPGATTIGAGSLLYDAIAGMIPFTEKTGALSEFKEALKRRYGSLDNILETLYADPLGAASDLSIVLGGVGAGAKAAGAISRTAGAAKAGEVLGETGRALTTASRVTDPLNLATTGIGKTVGRTEIAEKMYKRALNPSEGKINRPKIPGQISTGLREGITISRSGVNKLERLVDDLQSSIENVIKSNPNATINPREVAQYPERIKDMFRYTDEGQAVGEVSGVQSAYLKQHTPVQYGPEGFMNYRVRKEMPPPEPKPYSAITGQEEKISKYRGLRGQYDKLSGAVIEARKALAHGIKVQLEKWFPELKALNKREADLINLEGELERAVSRNYGRPMISGKDIMVGGAAGIAEGAEAGLAVGLIHKILRDPAMKSRIAIAINRAQQLNPKKFKLEKIGVVTSRVNAYLDAMANSILEDAALNAGIGERTGEAE